MNSKEQWAWDKARGLLDASPEEYAKHPDVIRLRARHRWPEMSVTATITPVKATIRKLKAKWTIEEQRCLDQQLACPPIPQLPYIETRVEKIERSYNPQYGDDRICVCGHPYYRHFDTYEQMDPYGCKYCACYYFAEKVE